MANFLRFRGQHYYLRVRVPADLHHAIPEREILKSLRTKDRKLAAATASRLHSNILEVFTLTRAGFIFPTQAKERLDGLLGRKQQPTTPEPPARQEEPTQAPSPALSDVVFEYFRDRQSGWTDKTKLEYEGYFKLIQDVLGAVKVSAITREKVRNLRDDLARLPANFYKKHPGKTVEEVLAMENVTPMSTTTVNKLLTQFGSLMRHCVKEGYLRENPAEGLKIQQKKRADEERRAYSKDDLKRMVAALPAPNSKPEKHWVPLIGMYSGMRLGEICGLHLQDIKQVDGVWCFDVNAQEDKTLKTLNSKRIIPIHPRLIDHGFIALVEKTRLTGSKRLWPNLKKRDIDGYCHSFGNWYGRFNRKHVTSDPLKSFHSLRHTFADTLKQQGEQETLISELMGHANGNISTGRYGKRFQPKVLLKAICNLNYDF